jgi:hypothetical protein
MKEKPSTVREGVNATFWGKKSFGEPAGDMDFASIMASFAICSDEPRAPFHDDFLIAGSALPPGYCRGLRSDWNREKRGGVDGESFGKGQAGNA